ncbi:polysaccharide biosynthesis protein [Qipengyuania atrilutea]|nr:nucleoside-diphosphate sugar epimerase/dehydratase [Actirhodobacter atriluteus]
MLDAVLCFASVMLATYLRLGFWPPVDDAILLPTAIAIATVVPLSLMMGGYRAIFRYAGSVSLFLSAKVALLHGFIFATIFTFIGVDGVPRTVGLLQPLILGCMMVMLRVVASSLLNRSITFPWQKTNVPTVLIYGAGRAGRQLALAIRASGEMNLAGFIDDDLSLQSRTLDGIRIYNPTELHTVVLEKQITDILLALPSAGRSRTREIVEQLKQFNLHIRTLPSYLDLAQGKVSVLDLKELEIEDLLGRTAVPPDLELLQRAITGRAIMITGAGGSIGSELCRQIAAMQPSVLILVDHSEFMLYSIEQELKRAAALKDGAGCKLVSILRSVTDEAKMDRVVAEWRPDCIFHAAAYKHVPLVEQNAVEGAFNNIIGTRTMADIAMRHGTEAFILISTDKAVRPTSVMGATKRVAELVLQAKSCNGAKIATRFSMVRFGNVLGSNGSVVPLFRKQIAEGGPVTVTHPDVVRYFMTIPEAAQLVIQAGAMATGGEVFLLDMGEPVKIVDLARNMIELSGMTMAENGQSGDIAIEFVGLRPGEKLFEELLIEDDAMPTDHPQILQAREVSLSSEELGSFMARLERAIKANDENAVRECLNEAVPDYRPAQKQVTLKAVTAA